MQCKITWINSKELAFVLCSSTALKRCGVLRMLCWCSLQLQRAGSQHINAPQNTGVPPVAYTLLEIHLWIFADTEVGSITYFSAIFISIGLALIAHISVLCKFLLSRVLLRPTSYSSVKILYSELSLNLTMFCFKPGWPHHMQFQILLLCELTPRTCDGVKYRA